MCLNLGAFKQSISENARFGAGWLGDSLTKEREREGLYLIYYKEIYA